MNIVKDNGVERVYGGNINGKFCEAILNNKNGRLVIRVDSNILGSNNYINLYKDLFNECKSINGVKDIRFEFNPSSELEFQNSNKIVDLFEIREYSSIKKVSRKKDRGIEDYFKANMIRKEENGKIKEYVERKVDSSGKEYMLEISLNEMEEELNNIINDNSINVDSLSDIEVANMVLDRIASRKKRYYMESSLEYEAKNEKEEAALNATGMDDKVNTEIGVVKKNPEDAMGNSYRAVERVGDNYNIVNPSVNEVSPIENSDSNEVELTSDESEVRDMEGVYYLDSNNGDIYNKDGEKIGNLSEGYRVNLEDNSLSKDGKKLGLIDDINSMGKTNDMNKPKVRTLEKPDDNMGIVDIKIIGYIIISAILIGVIIYLLSR